MKSYQARKLEKKEKDRLIPVFTVIKNGSILKNIFVIDRAPSDPASGPKWINDAEEVDGEVEEVLTVGRHPECNIVLTHPSISRFHLQINSRPASEKLFVTDLSSVHGTWISEKKIEPGLQEELKEGDTIKLGGSTRLYRLHWVPLSRAYDVENPFVPSPLSPRDEYHDNETSEKSPLTIQNSSIDTDGEVCDFDLVVEGVPAWFNDEEEHSGSSSRDKGEEMVKQAINDQPDQSSELEHKLVEKLDSSPLEVKVTNIPPVGMVRNGTGSQPTDTGLPVSHPSSVDLTVKQEAVTDKGGGMGKQVINGQQEQSSGLEHNLVEKLDSSPLEVKVTDIPPVGMVRNDSGIQPAELLVSLPSSVDLTPKEAMTDKVGEMVKQVINDYPSQSSVSLPYVDLTAKDEEKAMADKFVQTSVSAGKENSERRRGPINGSRRVKSIRSLMIQTGRSTIRQPNRTDSAADTDIYTPDKENLTPICMKHRSSSKMGHLEGRTRVSESNLSSSSSSRINLINPRGLLLQKDQIKNTRTGRVPLDPIRSNPSPKSTSGAPTAIADENSCSYSSSAQMAQQQEYPLANCGEVRKKRWIIVTDTTSLLNEDSRKSLQLLQGLIGTCLFIPRTVIRELDVLKQRRRLFDRRNEATLALEWVEKCMVEAAWWIHVPAAAPPPPLQFLSGEETMEVRCGTTSSAPCSACGKLVEIMHQTTEDQVLDFAISHRKARKDAQLVLLSNNTTLNIKAMAEGLLCETARAFRDSLVNPFSERFLFSGSAPRGLTWSVSDDIILKQFFYTSTLEKMKLPERRW